MTPILGITASSITSSTLGSFESIATISFSSGQNEVTFSNIPSGYKHLQVRGFVNSNASAVDNIYIRMNGSQTGYSWHTVYGNGSTTGSTGGTNDSLIIMCRVAGSATTTNFSGFVMDILDYTNTNKNKTIRSLSGFDRNGSGELWFWSGLWANTSAITSLSFSPAFSGTTTIISNSTLALYGIK